MSDERDQILGRVGRALASLSVRTPLPEWDRELVHVRSIQPGQDAWALFSARLAAVNGTALATTESLVALLEKGGWRRGYCDPALWPLLSPAFPATFAVETAYDRNRIDSYDFGITAATGAIAETGTLILSDRGTSSRLAALAPWVHIAVLRRADIHPDIPAAILALPRDPNVIWVTGPSKTADVEGILIEGVHGPGVQVALLIP